MFSFWILLIILTTGFCLLLYKKSWQDSLYLLSLACFWNISILLDEQSLKNNSILITGSLIFFFCLFILFEVALIKSRKQINSRKKENL